MAGGGGSSQGGGQQGFGQSMGGYGGGQSMGGFGGQQGGFGNSFGGGFGGQQPQQMQQMQRPMQNQFGGFNQSPQMGGYGGGMGGGMGGGFNQYNPMGGGYGMGGANPGMGGMGGFGGGQSPQMGGFGMGMGGQPMGGYGGGFGGGFNQPPQMGGFGGMQNSSINSFPDPRMRQNQGQSMSPMGGLRQQQSAYEGRPAPENNGGFGMGGMQGQQGGFPAYDGGHPAYQEKPAQPMGSQREIDPRMMMRGSQRMNHPAFAGLPELPIGQTGGIQGGGQGVGGMPGFAQSPGMSGASSPQLDQQYQAFMNQSAGRPDNYGQSVGGQNMNQGQMGGTGQIPEYARSYAQNQMGSLPTQSQMRGTPAPTGRSMTPEEFSSMIQSRYGRSA